MSTFDCSFLCLLLLLFLLVSVAWPETFAAFIDFLLWFLCVRAAYTNKMYYQLLRIVWQYTSCCRRSLFAIVHQIVNPKFRRRYYRVFLSQLIFHTLFALFHFNYISAHDETVNLNLLPIQVLHKHVHKFNS